MLKSKLKNITLFIGVLIMFTGGLIFIVMSDLTFKNNSGNLIISVLLCFGSAIVFFFSNNFNEKPVVMFIMKGLGLALAIGLIVYYHLFSTSNFYVEALEKLRKAGLAKKTEYEAAKASIIIALVFSYLATAVQAANIVLTATLKEDGAHSKSNVVELQQTDSVDESVSKADDAQSNQ